MSNLSIYRQLDTDNMLDHVRSMNCLRKMVGIMNFTEKIIVTIKNPGNAMEGIAQQPMIEEAVMIIGVYAVLSALNVYVQFSKITYEGMGNFQSIMMMTGLVFSLIGPFIVWLAVGGNKSSCFISCRRRGQILSPDDDHRGLQLYTPYFRRNYHHCPDFCNGTHNDNNIPG